jgi:hypothetical protein
MTQETTKIVPIFFDSVQSKSLKSPGWANYLTDAFLARGSDTKRGILSFKIKDTFTVLSTPDPKKNAQRSIHDSYELTRLESVQKATGCLALNFSPFGNLTDSDFLKNNSPTYIMSLFLPFIWPLHGRKMNRAQDIEPCEKETDIFITPSGLFFIPQTHHLMSTIKDLHYALDDITPNSFIQFRDDFKTNLENCDPYAKYVFIMCPEIGPETSAHMKVSIYKEACEHINFLLASNQSDRPYTNPKHYEIDTLIEGGELILI